jgi:hypothetical protein
MGPSVTDVTRGFGSLLVSLLALYFNVPRFIGPEAWMHALSTEHVHARHDDAGFHATATVEDMGKGKKRLTVQLEFNGAGKPDEDKGL